MNFSFVIFETFCFNYESEAKCPNTLILYTTDCLTHPMQISY